MTRVMAGEREGREGARGREERVRLVKPPSCRQEVRLVLETDTREEEEAPIHGFLDRRTVFLQREEEQEVANSAHLEFLRREVAASLTRPQAWDLTLALRDVQLPLPRLVAALLFPHLRSCRELGQADWLLLPEHTGEEVQHLLDQLFGQEVQVAWLGGGSEVVGSATADRSELRHSTAARSEDISDSYARREGRHYTAARSEDISAIVVRSDRISITSGHRRGLEEGKSETIIVKAAFSETATSAQSEGVKSDRPAHVTAVEGDGVAKSTAMSDGKAVEEEGMDESTASLSGGDGVTGNVGLEKCEDRSDVVVTESEGRGEEGMDTSEGVGEGVDACVEGIDASEGVGASGEDRCEGLVGAVGEVRLEGIEVNFLSLDPLPLEKVLDMEGEKGEVTKTEDKDLKLKCQVCRESCPNMYSLVTHEVEKHEDVKQQGGPVGEGDPAMTQFEPPVQCFRYSLKSS